MSAINRADQDIEHGDYGMARIRLASYLNTKGYDPALLDRLGQLSYDMRDPVQAGRYWLASNAQGEHIESAIKAFLRHTGSNAHSIAAQLPPPVRYVPPDSLPSVARERVRRFGLEETLQRISRVPREPRGAPSDRAANAIGWAVVLLVVLPGVTFLIVGVITVFGWLFG
jgi:hypothetical protein